MAGRGANMPTGVPKKKGAAQLKDELGLASVPDGEIIKVQTLFEYYDADANGCMDGPEFTKMAAELKGVDTGRDISGREAFREIDDDESGYLEVEELLVWWFKDNVDPGHIPTWDRMDPELALVAEEEDDGVMDHARTMFRKYDKDKGGEIDVGEFTALCYDMGFFFQDENDKKLVLSLLDTDGDGTISFKVSRNFFLTPILVATRRAYGQAELKSTLLGAAAICRLRMRHTQGREMGARGALLD